MLEGESPEDEPLEELPPEIRSLTALRELNLAGCRLESLPDWLPELTSLEVLELADNPIPLLPPSIGALTSLRALGLSGTPIATLDSSLRNLKALEVLAAPGARLYELPSWIGELESLRIMDISANEIEGLPHSTRLPPKLTHLIMWGHRLREFPSALSQLRDLEVLDLSNSGRSGTREVSIKYHNEQLVAFLHDLGTVLCFRDDPRLADTNILNPGWVTGGVYRLLNSNLAAQHKGLLAWQDVDEILNTPEYPRERRAFIIEMMKRFELCFESDKLLIPDLLTRQEPDTGTWDGALQFEIKYDVLPTSIISRLIVRMSGSLSKETVWRTGLVLAIDRNRALVKGDREDAIVKIAVVGPAAGRRGLLTAIRTELRVISESIPGLTCEERVPVPGQPSVWVPYAHLLELEAAGHSNVIPQGLTESFSIRELLDGVETPADRLEERVYNSPAAQQLPSSSIGRVDGAAPPWTYAESMRLGAGLLVALVVVVGLFVGADTAVGTAPAAGITSVAVIAVVVIAALVLRSAGRISENGMIATLRDLLGQ